MSLIDGLDSGLASMGTLQLALAMLATIAYSVLLNASFRRSVRSTAGLLALVGAAAFSAMTPSWMSGVVLMALTVAGFGVFAVAALLLSELFGLGTTREVYETRLAPVSPEERFRVAHASGAQVLPQSVANSL